MIEPHDYFFYVNEPNEKKTIRTINQTKSLLFLHIEIVKMLLLFAAAAAGGGDGAEFLCYCQMEIKRKCSA